MAQQVPLDVEERIQKLKTAAKERWGDAWTVEVKHWADGTHQCYAYHMNGRTPEGHREKEQLLFDAEGEIHHERLVQTPEELIEREELD